MNNFIFENATKTYFGRGCVKEYLGCLVRGSTTVMLAYGGSAIKENGIYDEVTGILAAARKIVVEFGGIPSGPTLGNVLEGATLARQQGVDLVLAVGGGSVMDCCKAICLAAVYPGDIWEDFWARPGVVDFSPLPLGVIVTAAGTGSEMNGAALITYPAKKVKTGRDNPACGPRFALMDPAYTLHLPPRQTARGGFTTLSHLMETYFSAPNTENVSDDLAEALMRGVIRDLEACLQRPDNYNARSNLMWEATMAENRILKLGKRRDVQCRQMAHQLSAYTGCDHGEALAVLHPAYYRHICHAAPEKFARFAVRVWGLCPTGQTEEALAQSGVEALAAFVEQLDLPATLRQLGVTDAALLPQIAASCELSRGSFRPMTRPELLVLLQECF